MWASVCLGAAFICGYVRPLYKNGRASSTLRLLWLISLDSKPNVAISHICTHRHSHAHTPAVTLRRVLVFVFMTAVIVIEGIYSGYSKGEVCVATVLADWVDQALIKRVHNNYT